MDGLIPGTGTDFFLATTFRLAVGDQPISKLMGTEGNLLGGKVAGA
jgi:hypothetical protein